MSVSPLLPVAGIAAATLAQGAVAAVDRGLSFAAELLRPSKPTEVAAANSKNEITGQKFEQAVRDFARRLQERLAMAGVSSSQPIELVSDGQGGVQVSGDHPERALIEQTLNGDQQLLTEFQKLADQCRQLAPSEEERDRRDFGLFLAGEEVQPFLK